jgi:hypothetical protein
MGLVCSLSHNTTVDDHNISEGMDFTYSGTVTEIRAVVGGELQR